MSPLTVAIHGILTRQTDPRWPDRLDAWWYRRDPSARALKKEYAAGPFPRWNCFVKDPRLARGLAAEIELFKAGNTLPPTWIVAHSNCAVIALLVTRRLIERGFWVEGLVLTGGACDADLQTNGVGDWVRSGRLGAAIAYRSAEDHVVAGNPRAARFWAGKVRSWLWARLIWPYGSLGRTGWLCQGLPFLRGEASHEPWRARVFTRWYPGGHSGYFAPTQIETTFARIHQDIRDHTKDAQ